MDIDNAHELEWGPFIVITLAVGLVVWAILRNSGETEDAP